MTPSPISSAVSISSQQQDSSATPSPIPEWHSILAHANQCVSTNDLKNAHALFVRAKFLRKVKKTPENPSSWAIYLDLLEKERASTNKSLSSGENGSGNGNVNVDLKRAMMRDSLQKLYETVTGLIPFTTSNRHSEEYLSIWLGYAKLQAEDYFEDARKTFKRIKNCRIGTYFPVLYETWAQLEEQHGNPEKAAKLRAEAEKLPPIASALGASTATTSSATSSSAKTSSQRSQPSAKTTKTTSARNTNRNSPPTKTKARSEKISDVPAVGGDTKSKVGQQKRNIPRSDIAEDNKPVLAPASKLRIKVEVGATQKRVPLAIIKEEDRNVNINTSNVRNERKAAVIPEKRRHPSPPATPPVAKRVHELRSDHHRSKENSPPEQKKVLSPRTEAITQKYLRPEGCSRRPIRGYDDETQRRYWDSPPRSRLDEAFSRSNRVLVNGRAYQVLRQVGRGGSSQVFQVISENMEILALKKVQVSPDNHFALSSYANEISLLDKLKGEKDIVQLHDAEVNRVTGTIHLLMECGDTDLSSLLKGRTHDADEIRSYWRQMLQAVNTIHAHKVIHGDLKPANFISAAGRIKLIDFGIAKAIADSNDDNDCTKIVRECITGTPNYMAPEALLDISMEYVDEGEGEGNVHKGGRRKRGFRVGRGSDIWSLGCILYQIIHGKTPFAHIRDANRKISAIKDANCKIEFGANIDANVLDVLQGCLQRDPSKRMTIPQLLQHPFLNGGTVGSVSAAGTVNMSMSSPVRTNDIMEALKEENIFLCDRRFRPLPPTSARSILDRILTSAKSKNTTKTRSSRFGKSHINSVGGTPSVSAVTKL